MMLNIATSITPFPCPSPSRTVFYVGQYSMQITAQRGSGFRANQQPDQPLPIRIMVPAIWCIAIVVAVKSAYRQLAVRDIIVKLPRKLFMQLIYKRTYTAKTFFEVAVIELAVVAYSWWFAGAASDVA